MADMATWTQAKELGSRVHALNIPPPSSPSTFSLAAYSSSFQIQCLYSSLLKVCHCCLSRLY
jgi:hypothetical protein